MIIVGSTALEKWGLNRAKPKDVDRWHYESLAEPEDLVGDAHIVPDHIMDMIPVTGGFARPDAIYTIKCSHLAWDIKWEKTKNDILWLHAKGCKLLPELYRELKRHWETEHGDKSYLSLKRSKEDFFNDYVTKKYDHDYLHELVALPNRPMYERCLKGGEEVLVDRSKFDQLPFEDQVRMFREEISVIALERWILNPKWRGDWYKAHGLALKKTIISLTKNWANDFIVQHLSHFVLPDWDYFKTIAEIEEDIMSRALSSEEIEFFKGLSEKAAFSDLDEMVVAMANDDFYPYPEEVIEKASEDAEKLTEQHYPGWRQLKYNDPEYRSARQYYWQKQSAAQENYEDEIGPLVDNFEHLMQEGGGEGGSEYCEGVFKINDTCYHVSWSYYSHHGYESDGAFHSVTVVEPTQRTVTVYN